MASQIVSPQIDVPHARRNLFTFPESGNAHKSASQNSTTTTTTTTTMITTTATAEDYNSVEELELEEAPPSPPMRTLQTKERPRARQNKDLDTKEKNTEEKKTTKKHKSSEVQVMQVPNIQQAEVLLSFYLSILIILIILMLGTCWCSYVLDWRKQY